jgi:hypothetical protein
MHILKFFFNVGQLFNVVPIICKFLDQIYGHIFSDFDFAKPLTLIFYLTLFRKPILGPYFKLVASIFENPTKVLL